MSTSKFEFSQIAALLRRSENDARVRDFFGPAITNIERDEYYGSLEFKSDGVDVVFKEAPWIVPADEVVDPEELYLAAFHLHGEGHEGYSGYSCQLPNGVALGDPEDEVLRKMGPPHSSGGGGISKLLKRPVPRWFRYALGGSFLHFQLDAAGLVDMVTLDASDGQAGLTARLAHTRVATTGGAPSRRGSSMDGQ